MYMAQRPPSHAEHLDTVGSDLEADASDATSDRGATETRAAIRTEGPPALFHKVRNPTSVLALAASADRIYAGTQGGGILVWASETYELVTSIAAHYGSVLCLSLSADGKFLFSSAGDAIVNVWCTKKLVRLYSIYSRHDVGDIFCVAYCDRLQTLFLGAQNASIQVRPTVWILGVVVHPL